MDFDRYFTVNEQDLHNASNLNGDWEHSNEQTARFQIRLEDSLSTSLPTWQRAQLEAKPLPPVPEELEATSLPMPTSQTAAPSSRNPKAAATRIPGSDGRQRAPRRGSDSSPECSPTQRTDQQLSWWPTSRPSDVRKPSRICTITLQQNIDGSSYHPDFDSPHSQESCDLDQWAIDIYGPQDCAMTSLRDKRRVVSRKSPLLPPHKDQLPAVTMSPILKHYADSAYCSSTSSSSTDNERSTSPTSPSDTLALDSERRKFEDPAPSSFFEDSEVRPPAKKFWRKMASSLRPIKSKTNLRGTDPSPNSMPMISA